MSRLLLLALVTIIVAIAVTPDKRATNDVQQKSIASANELAHWIKKNSWIIPMRDDCALSFGEDAESNEELLTVECDGDGDGIKAMMVRKYKL